MDKNDTLTQNSNEIHLKIINEYVASRQLDCGAENEEVIVTDKNEKRLQYRYILKERDDIDIVVENSDGLRLLAKPHNICAEGISLKILSKNSKAIKINKTYKLTFAFKKINFVITSFANCKFNLDRKSFYFCGFQIQNHNQFLEKLHPDLLKFFNERTTFRVKPKENEVVVIEINHNGKIFSGTMIDVSFSGLVVIVKQSIKADLVKKVVALSFKLPNSDAIIHLWGEVKYQTQVKDMTRLGLQFMLN
ncbi:MAG: PilZ domain-containing protein [Methylococcales bacterium]|jgi:hypothetical protein|nr:PilZ domain-containing protein [Methylococcales bacterium]MBT7408670.1 PilZ domain-containing protein [Methylococcales bacterium]